MSNKRRVVVTGMGVISPIGNTLDTLWESLMQGKSGIGPLTLVAPEVRTCEIGGECREFEPEQYMDKKDARRMDRYIQMGVAASRIAYDDSGLNNLNGSLDLERFGVVIGTGSGGIRTIETQLINAQAKGYEKTSPFLVPMMLCDSAAGRVAIEFKAKGPNMAVVTACASGAHSIGDAVRIIQNDEADVMIAGGAESPMTPLALAGFTAARALSPQVDSPETASRPFDKDRDGFVIAEGAGILILEELEHAKARGAKIYGEFAGYGRSADANDIVAPCADGEGAARAMKAAFRESGLKPEEIGYVNAHGTSTPLGDIAETMAIKRQFGDYAKNGLLVSSSKSMTGHLLGAAGALEMVICMLALNKKIVPPTINLDNPDEQCDLDYVAHTPRKAENLKAVLNNSFGFGGHNATLIFKEFQNN